MNRGIQTSPATLKGCEGRPSIGCDGPHIYSSDFLRQMMNFGFDSRSEGQNLNNILIVVFMKFNRLSAAIGAMAFPLVMMAVPANTALMQLYNSDGTCIEGYLVGDEHFHYVVSADHSTLLEQNTSGVWNPVIRDGRKLQPVKSDIEILRTEMFQPTPGYPGLAWKNIWKSD